MLFYVSTQLWGGSFAPAPPHVALQHTYKFCLNASWCMILNHKNFNTKTSGYTYLVYKIYCRWRCVTVGYIYTVNSKYDTESMFGKIIHNKKHRMNICQKIALNCVYVWFLAHFVRKFSFPWCCVDDFTSGLQSIFCFFLIRISVYYTRKVWRRRTHNNIWNKFESNNACIAKWRMIQISVDYFRLGSRINLFNGRKLRLYLVGFSSIQQIFFEKY